MIRAKRGCRFGGKNYSAGEIVPETAVDKKSIGALVMMKIIELVPDKPAPKLKPKKSNAGGKENETDKISGETS